MRHLPTSFEVVGRLAGSTPRLWAEIATKAARKRSQQAQVVPFTKALAAFVDKISTLETHRDAAVKHQNDRSLSTVLDFVKSLAKASNAYPPAMAENVAFIIRDPQSGKQRNIGTLLRTTGGDCSQAVGKSMSSLFAGAGTPSHFYWDEGMWQLSNKPPDESKVQDARAKAAASGVPSSEPMTLQELEAVQARMAANKSKKASGLSQLHPSPITDAAVRDSPQSAGHAADLATSVSSPEDSSSISISSSEAALNGSADGAESAKQATSNMELSPRLAVKGPEADGNSVAEEAQDQGQEVDTATLEAQVLKLQPLLAALAAVPWIDPAAENGRRVPFIKSTVLDEVEGMGWDVRGGVSRVWAGERDVDQVLAGKDPGSRRALQAVMDLTLKFEQDFGKKILSEEDLGQRNATGV